MIAAATICGRISPAGFSSIRDRRLLESMRDQTDASIMGAGTLREADPEMRCSGGRLPENRIRAFVTGTGNLPLDNKKVFDSGPRPFIFVPEGKIKEIENKVSGKACIKGIPGPAGRVSMVEVFKELRLMGAERILVEGGGCLNHFCLKEGVIDEIFLTIAPFISGDRAASSVADSGDKISSLMKLELTECNHSRETGEIFLKYRVIK